MSNDFKLVESEKPIDVAWATTSVIRELDRSYLLSIDIELDGSIRRIHFPSFGKSKQYGNRLNSCTFSTPFGEESVKYTLYKNGNIKFWNQWSNPDFDKFKNDLLEALHARRNFKENW